MTVARAPHAGFERLWPVLLLGLGAGAVLWPWLALPASFASFIGLITASKFGARARVLRAIAIAAALGSGIGLVRFIVSDAVPGMVGGGREAVENQAVSRLRDVLFAEDAMRRAGWIDPDRDGVGSAAFLSELCGGPPARGQPPRATPVLHCDELVPSAIGPAARSGAYLYTVCLPLAGGGWSASAGPVDEEAAERRFLAYAWPETPGRVDHVFFIDEHENIRMAPARGGPPRCDAALVDPGWQPWKNKKPRTELPGARSERPAPRTGSRIAAGDAWR